MNTNEKLLNSLFYNHYWDECNNKNYIKFYNIYNKYIKNNDYQLAYYFEEDPNKYYILNSCEFNDLIYNSCINDIIINKLIVLKNNYFYNYIENNMCLFYNIGGEIFRIKNINELNIDIINKIIKNEINLYTWPGEINYLI